jgi:superfamily II DNA/RNA helicase
MELFRSLEIIVLDEADMLLDGGFLNQIEQVLVARKRVARLNAVAAVDNALAMASETGVKNADGSESDVAAGRPRRERWWRGGDDEELAAHSSQVVLSAATIPNYGLKSADELVKRKFPAAVRVETRLLHHTQPQLRQEWVQLSLGGGELDELADFMAEEVKTFLRESKLAGGDFDRGKSFPRTMIFTNTVGRAHAALAVLTEALVGDVEGLLQEGSVRGYHKEVKADEREQTLRSFSLSGTPPGTTSLCRGDNGAANCRVLVCTDLAARGLDIEEVDHVVQFDFADNVVQHLHRLGRTARAGRPGRATHFVKQGSELAEMIRAATEKGEALDESFSRKRGFRKKIKKTGRAFNAKARSNTAQIQRKAPAAE